MASALRSGNQSGKRSRELVSGFTNPGAARIASTTKGLGPVRKGARAKTLLASQGGRPSRRSNLAKAAQTSNELFGVTTNRTKLGA